MVEVTIDPTTRIEGHHGTTLEVEDDEVVEAKSHMKMFRGAEIITIGRPPYDAPHLTGKVCGVCFTCHRLASSKAVEDAAQEAGVFEGPPRNAVLLRDALEGIFYLWNHAVHLYALVGPDYSDAVADTGLERLDPIEGAGYQAALEQQRKLLKAFAEFGGRAPHSLTYVPGGMAGQPDPATVQSVRSRVAEVSEWLGPTDAAPEVLERYLEADDIGDVEGDPDLGEGLHDIVGLLVAAAGAGTAEHGVGPGRYYSNGVFDLPEEDGMFLDRGIYRDGAIEPKTKDEIVESITESTARSWYTDDSGGHPAEAKPPEPEPDKDDAYSWGKAPRYDGETMEVGPLARLVVADLDPFDLRAELGGGPAESNTLNRLIARAQEALLVRDEVLGWLEAIEYDEPFVHEWTDDFTGQGVGLWEPARGALSHWVSVDDGEIDQYQIITPTLWNLGPRDGDDQPSVMEEGLVGMEVEDVENPMNVMRTIRSFDPCLACAVHVQSPDAEYETIIEPARPEAGVGAGPDDPRGE